MLILAFYKFNTFCIQCFAAIYPIQLNVNVTVDQWLVGGNESDILRQIGVYNVTCKTGNKLHTY